MRARTVGFSLMEFALSLTLLSLCVYGVVQWCNFRSHYSHLTTETAEIIPYINTFLWRLKAKQITLNANDCLYGKQDPSTKERLFSLHKEGPYACTVRIKKETEDRFLIQFYGYYKKHCVFEFYR